MLVCIGGLFDGDLIVKAQMLLQGKSAYAGGGMIRDVGPSTGSGPRTPTFRANLLVPEGARSSVAVINLQDGIVLQELPFDIELRKFIVEYYETGMPKLFASEIVIHDHETGKAEAATVKVNEPAFHRGVAIYQSSFDDGGSSVKLRALPMTEGGKPFEVQGTIGGSTQLSDGDNGMTLEFTGLRVINVENLSEPSESGGTDVRKVDLAATLGEHLGSGGESAQDAGASQRGALDQLQAPRRVGSGARVQQLHAAGRARRPERLPGRHARQPRTTACATCAFPPTRKAASTAGSDCARRCPTRPGARGSSALRRTRRARRPPGDGGAAEDHRAARVEPVRRRRAAAQRWY